jgi:protease-4
MKKPKPFTLLVLLHTAVIGIALALLWRQPSERRHNRETIMIIPIEGMITMGRGAMGHGDSVDDIVSTIDHLSEQPEVKAIVLKINSPGGSVGAVQAIHGALQRFRKTGRHVVSSFGDVAASGGYYVACAGDKIVSYPGTLTGSIGVVLQLPNVTGLMQKIGVRMDAVTSGPMKDAGSPFRTMTPGEQKYFKAVVMDAYGQFFEAVKTGRKMPEADLRKIADGRVMSGKMALDAKLVDKLGGLSDAVDLAKEISGLAGKNPRIVEHDNKPALGRILELLSKTPVDHLMDYADTGVRLSYLLN